MRVFGLVCVTAEPCVVLLLHAQGALLSGWVAGGAQEVCSVFGALERQVPGPQEGMRRAEMVFLDGAM